MTGTASLIDALVENRTSTDRACDGSRDCQAELHIHGCFADRGSCDEPLEHAAGRPVYDKTTGEYLGQA